MYTKILFILLISISVSLVFAQSSSFHLISKIPNTFYDGDIPKITGIVLDQSFKPVSDAQIRIKYPSETIQVTSNTDGSFNVSPTIPFELGSLYGTSMIISKQGYTTSVFPIQYSVIERPPPPVINTTSIEKIQDTGIANQITNSSTDKFLEKQIELSQTKLEIIQNNTNQNNILNKQRDIAQQTLANDIAKSENDYAKYNPFNVFSEFVVGFDESIKNIFLGQFAITQTQHQEGQKAQNAALANGQDSKSAMIAFQEKAQISRDTIIDLNNKINANIKPINQSENSTKQ